MCSACQVSIDSISAEAAAASTDSPLPCDVDRLRPLGRMAANTGIPRQSSPVRFASRVIPSGFINGRARASVAAGTAARCVPSR